VNYVEQSLTSGEKIYHIGRFHWIYLVNASFWLFFGAGVFFAVIIAGMTWDVRTDMSATLPNLPDQYFWQGWADTIARRGGYIAVLRDLHPGLKLLAFGGLLVGAALFGQMMIIKATTEIAVTTKRLVIKEGVIARRVDEMNIDRIESVHVTQSVLGRLLDFGVVQVRGMGVGEITLPVLARPIAIRQAIEKAKFTAEARETW